MNDSSLRVERAPAPGAGTPSLLAKQLASVVATSAIPGRFVLADGGIIDGGRDPAYTVVFRTRAAERRIVRYGHVGLLEAYFDGGVDVDGSLPLAFRAAMDAGFDNDTNMLVSLRNRWHELRYSNRSIAQAKANARFHYGLGQAFYRQWLDVPAMMYTCAYWSEGTKTLEEAQRNKMDHVCRKVRLARGETFVDVGSGWGGSSSTRGSDTAPSGPASTRRPSRSPRRVPKSSAAGSPTGSGSSSATSARFRASTTSSCRSARSSTPDATSCRR